MEPEEAPDPPRNADKWYKAAKFFAVAFAASSIIPIAAMLMEPDYSTMLPEAPPSENYQYEVYPQYKKAVEERPSDLSLAILISLGALIVSGMGTVSTVILGWRNERRQAAEFRLKIEHLEYQLGEARRKQEPPAPPAS